MLQKTHSLFFSELFVAGAGFVADWVPDDCVVSVVVVATCLLRVSCFLVCGVVLLETDAS